MRVLLFTVLDCRSCDRHRRALFDLLNKEGISGRVYNIDDARYLSLSLNAMKKYGIRKTPSIVLLDSNNEMIESFQGIEDSIKRLEQAMKIYEK